MNKKAKSKQEGTEMIQPYFDDKITKEMDNFLQSDFRWAVHTLSDINYIANMIDKSMLPIIDKRSKNNVLAILEKAKNRPDLLTKESYYFIMNMVNSAIVDDHTHIQLPQFIDQFDPKFGGYLCDLICTGNDRQFKIVMSIDPRIKLNYILTKINNTNALKFIQQQSSILMKKTNSEISNLKKTVLLSTIYNPLNTIYNITLMNPVTKKEKSVKVKYIEAKKGYFGILGGNLFDAVNNILIGPKNDKLYVQKMPKAKLMYFHLHSFPSYGEELDILLRQSQAIKSDDSEWIVLDVRSNFGGSLTVLYVLTYHLFGKQVVEQIVKCQTNTFSTDKDFVKMYYDQVIIPVISDPKVSPIIKKQYQSIDAYYKQNNDKQVLTEHKSPSCKCKESILKTHIKKLSQQILSGKQFKKILIVSNQICFSACVHTYQFLKLFPNVITLGRPIGSTRLSGNPLSIPLLSRMGSIHLPQLLVHNNNKLINNAIDNNQTEQVDVFIDDSIIHDQETILIKILENKPLFNDIYKTNAKKALKQK